MKITESRLRQIIREEVKRSVIREADEGKYGVYFRKDPENPNLDGYAYNFPNNWGQFNWSDGDFTYVSDSDVAAALIKGDVAPGINQQELAKVWKEAKKFRVYASGPDQFELKDAEGKTSFGTFSLGDLKSGEGFTPLPKAGKPDPGKGKYPVKKG